MFQNDNIISSFTSDVRALRRVEKRDIVTWTSSSPPVSAFRDRTGQGRQLDNMQFGAM
jgi:hypothetical protein